MKEYFIVSKNETLESLMQKMTINAHRTVFVLEKKKMIGLITQGDIINSLIYKKKFNSTAENIMNKSFVFLKKKDFNEAKKIFKKYLCPIIPIVNSMFELIDSISIEEYLNTLE